MASGWWPRLETARWPPRGGGRRPPVVSRVFRGQNMRGRTEPQRCSLTLPRGGGVRPQTCWSAATADYWAPTGSTSSTDRSTTPATACWSRKASQKQSWPASRTSPRNPEPVGPLCSASTGSTATSSLRAQVRRILIGPLAVDGSTARPRWVMTTSSAATSRRAARRAGSISSLHRSGSTSLAASLGHIVAPPARRWSRARIAVSRAVSTGRIFRCRHASEQYLTSCQFFANPLRHDIVRPHDAQTLDSLAILTTDSTLCAMR